MWKQTATFAGSGKVLRGHEDERSAALCRAALQIKLTRGLSLLRRPDLGPARLLGCAHLLLGSRAHGALLGGRGSR